MERSQAANVSGISGAMHRRSASRTLTVSDAMQRLRRFLTWFWSTNLQTVFKRLFNVAPSLLPSLFPGSSRTQNSRVAGASPPTSPSGDLIPNIRGSGAHPGGAELTSRYKRDRCVGGCNQNLRVIIFYEASAAPGSSGRRRLRSLLAGGMDHCFIECQETGRRCTQPATAAANLGSAAGGGQGQGKVWKLIELVVSSV